MAEPILGGPPVDAVCPVCSTASAMVLSAVQAFCTNEDGCNVLMFDPSLPDGGLSNARTVNLDEREDPDVPRS